MAFYLPLLQPHFKHIEIGDTLTSLWSGCGSIVECTLDAEPCVIKAIKIPSHINHPKIKQSEFALKRKQQSYCVEYNFYKRYSPFLPNKAKSIECVSAINSGDDYALVFKNFTKHGFAQASSLHIKAILTWLAHFHAFNLNKPATGLWQQGNYWHLSTRPDEYKKLDEALDEKSDIKNAAHKLDKTLQASHFKTLIHGDAKLANFAASEQSEILAYDFQYVGAGVGVTDVMYFMTSCFNEEQLHKYADTHLAYYFSQFKNALKVYQPTIIADDVIAQWQELWSITWADFYRFLAGWSPTHFKINSYMMAQVNTTLANNNL
ncbi:kinase [Pseudoalteromonas sp. S3785]|uniref:phosphotransferase n=1 Tax=Pseudoalteromonas sp. S3785 TaxID=579545 RepID=UPI00110B58BA|nr:phosphotransferase [Pseudoalteromonas sp. S3785]TMO73554.1 kinase [Pseudoalteromonas sp. S3785]